MNRNLKKTPHKTDWVPKLSNNQTVNHNFCSNEYDTSEPPWCYYSTSQVRRNNKSGTTKFFQVLNLSI